MFCSFFGHHNYSLENFDCLSDTLERLVVCEGVDGFYVGNKGEFDRAVHLALKKLKWKYPHIKTFLVLDTAASPDLGRLSLEESEYMKYIKNFELIVPDGIESVPKRYAMSYRNKWMVKECDIAVVYYLYPATNTQRYVDMLIRAGKPFINTADIDSGGETEY